MFDLAILPEEIIGEIIALLFPTFEPKDLHYPEDGLPYVPQEPTNSEGSPPTSVLLVSRVWHRIGVPLLYRHVRFRNARDAETVSRILEREPALGRVIRSLRIEGDMGQHFQTVVRHAPNIETLYISLYAHSPGSADWLRCLQDIKLKMLCIHVVKTPNFEFVHAEQVLQLLIRDHWTSLGRIDLCNFFPDSRGWRTLFREMRGVKELYIGPMVAAVWCRHWALDLDHPEALSYLGRLVLNDSIERVLCRYSPEDRIVGEVLASFDSPDRCPAKFMLENSDGTLSRASELLHIA